MSDTPLTADELLAGANATYRVEIPAQVLRPGQQGEGNGTTPATVQIRPLTIGAFQLILKAAKDDPGMIPLLMVKEALAEPQMTLAQVQKMHLGLVEHLVAHIREISGMGEKKNS